LFFVMALGCSIAGEASRGSSQKFTGWVRGALDAEESVSGLSVVSAVSAATHSIRVDKTIQARTRYRATPDT
jgi:hypothetical protein